jgi:hypothetical protein
MIAASGLFVPLSPPLQHVRMHSPDPCAPCLQVRAGSRVPPFGQGEVVPPQTHAPPPATHVPSSSPDELPDDSPLLLAVATLPDVEVDEVEPASLVPVLSSELHACVKINAAVEKNEMKRSPRFM